MWNRSDQNYIAVESIKPGYGYWIYSYEDCKLLARVQGISVRDNYITDLITNWNIVGLPYDLSVYKQNITVYHNGVEYSWFEAVNNSIILDFIYTPNETNQNYITTDNLQPGKAYWMYAYHNCTLKK
jgi:hypothetical protein